jgi:hypothetical protein
LNALHAGNEKETAAVWTSGEQIDSTGVAIRASFNSAVVKTKK